MTVVHDIEALGPAAAFVEKAPPLRL